MEYEEKARLEEKHHQATLAYSQDARAMN